MKLVDVYDDVDFSARFLYALLLERRPDESISHRRMPSFDDHRRFIDHRPYLHWYLIRSKKCAVGSVYLTPMDEIGVHVLYAARGSGLGKKAVKAIMSRHPRKQFLANINPANFQSISFFKGLGFRLIQQTYALEAST